MCLPVPLCVNVGEVNLVSFLRFWILSKTLFRSYFLWGLWVFGRFNTAGLRHGDNILNMFLSLAGDCSSLFIVFANDTFSFIFSIMLEWILMQFSIESWILLKLIVLGNRIIWNTHLMFWYFCCFGDKYVLLLLRSWISLLLSELDLSFKFSWICLRIKSFLTSWLTAIFLMTYKILKSNLVYSLNQESHYQTSNHFWLFYNKYLRVRDIIKINQLGTKILGITLSS